MGEDNQRENFFRIIGLVVDPGTEILRGVLHSQIPPDQLSSYLNERANKDIIDKLLKKGVINDTQYELLTKSDSDAKEFDITLLVTVLRNICTAIQGPNHSKGWAVKPEDIDDSDHSLGAEILRLKNIRNSITAHTPSTHLPTDKFEKLWGQIKDIILSIADKVPYQTEFERNAKSDSINEQITKLYSMKINTAGKQEAQWLKRFHQVKLQEVEEMEQDIKEILTLLDDSSAQPDIQELCCLIGKMQNRFRNIVKGGQDKEAWRTEVKELTDGLSIRKTLSDWNKPLEQRKRQLPYYAYDAYIFYAKDDKAACQESVRQIRTRSTVPELKIALYEDLPLSDLTVFERMDFIIENCRYIFFYVTPSFKDDTVKKFEADMCLNVVLKEHKPRVIPIWTKPREKMTNIPISLGFLTGLELWMLDGREEDTVIETFDREIIRGRKEIP